MSTRGESAAKVELPIPGAGIQSISTASIASATGASFTNTGTFEATGTFDNSGTFTNSGGTATLHGGAAFTNNAGAKIENSAAFATEASS